MPDVLITDFFTKQTKTSEKRRSSKLDQDEDPEWTPTKAAKRAKVTTGKGKLEGKDKSTRPRSLEPALGRTDDGATLPTPLLPRRTHGASSSNFKSPGARRDAIVFSVDDPEVAGVGNASDAPAKANLFSQYRSPLPPSGAPSSSYRYRRRTPPREESIVPPTPERLLTTSRDSITPIRLRFKSLSQTWSDETVGSSQSQEDGDLEYGGPCISLTRTVFGAPRSNWATKGSVDFEGKDGGLYNGGTSPARSPPGSPPIVRSSQSQSQYLSMEHASPQRLRGKATVLIDESLEIIESSQSQEKELDITTVLSQRAGWHIRRSTTPDIPHPSPLKRTLSLTKELPVRRLSLYEDEDPGPLADDLSDSRPLFTGGSQFTPRRSRRETQEWDTPSQRQVASTLLGFDCVVADQSCPSVSPSRSIRFGSSQGFPLSQPFAFTQPSQAFPSLPSSQAFPTTPVVAAVLQEESQTQESIPPSIPVRNPQIVPPQSLPSEVKKFHAMFGAGEEVESYPLDFPMSLRIVNPLAHYRQHVRTEL
ncbi:hypothetical protein FA13DRAFT_1704662 [Coprinellus micaceus]|uniref:Uncharacterized protein n=1 Tax=Coprinellus micaceus TaxID=71717 RepID=A0A4Y7TY24_COPMI|nr:hypothetical protein FA13DRAFT_1704662 [Coprinellus micaceus]